MSDTLAATLIIVGVVPLAIGIAYGRDFAACAWTAMRHRKTKRGHVLAAWPSDTMPACQSWIGAEISAPVIAEAEGIAERAWVTWKPEKIEEDVDDRNI